MGYQLPYKISHIAPTNEAWTLLQASSIYASPFQTPEYHDFLLAQTNHKPLILTVSSDSVLLSLILIDLQSNGSRIIRPFTMRAIVHGGPLISPECPDDALRLLLDAAINLSRRNRAVYFEIRPYFNYTSYAQTFAACRLNYIDYADCVIDTSSPEIINNNIQRRKRRQIRAALRQGIDFIDKPTDAQITEFYSMLHRCHWQRARRPIPTLCYFLDLAHTSIATIMLAYHCGQLIAGSVLLHDSTDTAYHYYVAGEDHQYHTLEPSSVITYHTLHYANAIGCRCVSLMGAGRLSTPFGVREFKRRMGAKVVPTGRYLFQINPFIYRLASFALNLLRRGNA